MQEKKEEDLQQVLNKVFEVGIDEVGRGAIFGPVFAAAVVLNEKNISILKQFGVTDSCLLYTSPSPRDRTRSRMPSSA